MHTNVYVYAVEYSINIKSVINVGAVAIVMKNFPSVAYCPMGKVKEKIQYVHVIQRPELYTHTLCQCQTLGCDKVLYLHAT